MLTFSDVIDCGIFFSLLRKIEDGYTYNVQSTYDRCSYYFAPILKCGSKIFSSIGLFLTFFLNPMFVNYIHATIGIFFTSEREIIFSLNCSKFAAECDWNSKSSQNVQDLGFLEK